MKLLAKFLPTLYVISRVMYSILMIIGCTFIVLWIFEPTRLWLTKSNIFDDNSYIGVVTAVIIFSGGMLWIIQQKVEKIHKKLESDSKNKNKIIEKGTGEIYPHLREAIESLQMHKDNDTKELYIAGLMLFTAWPQLQNWLNDKSLHLCNWDIYLFLLDPEFLNENSFLPTWKNYSETIIGDVLHFRETKKELLKEKKIKLKLATYKEAPAVHGFQIGTETMLSFTHKDSNGKWDNPDYFYECFNVEDADIRSKLYCNYFNSWLHFLKNNSKPNEIALPTVDTFSAATASATKKHKKVS